MSSRAAVEPIDAALLLEWRALLDRHPLAAPFLIPEWSLAWFEATRRKPRALTWRRCGELTTILPVVRIPGGWKSAAASVSDVLDPLGATPDLEETRAQLGVAVLSLPHCRATSGTAQDPCWVLDLPPTWAEYEAMLGKSLRTDVRRGFRRQDLEVGPGDLDTLVGLHRQRWRRRGLPGAFRGRAMVHQRRWIETAPEGAVRIDVLRHQSQPIGAIMTLHQGRRTCFYQSGIDPTRGALSPGTVLVAHAIRAAIERGDQVFDFLRGDEPYKRRWMPQRREDLAWAVAGPDWIVQGLGNLERTKQRVKRRFEGTS